MSYRVIPTRYYPGKCVNMFLWLVLVLLTINLGIATVWFTYALLIEARFKSSLVPGHWWDRNPLGRLLLRAQRQPSLFDAVLNRRWDLLTNFQLAEPELTFLNQCTDDELESMLGLAAQIIDEREQRQATGNRLQGCATR